MAFAPEYPLIDRVHPVNQNHRLNKGLVAWWLNLPHLQGGSVLRDLMGQHDGPLVNMSPTTDWIQPDLSRNAMSGELNFNGVGGYVDAGTSVSGSSAGVSGSCWVKMIQNATTGIISKRTNPSGGEYQIHYISPSFGVNVWAASGITGASGSTISIGTWYHLAFSYDSVNGLKIYKDGVLDGTGAAMGAPLQDTSSLQFGRDHFGNDAHMQLDDVRIYNRALSDSEVAQLYQLSSTNYRGLLNQTKFLPAWLMAAAFVPPAGSCGFSVIGSALIHGYQYR